MIVRSLDEINDTDADIRTETWRSRRVVLAKEGVGFSFHETVLYAGTETSMWYANHIELVHCIEGEAEVTNDETGETHLITPGTLYLLNGHEHHTVRPKTDFRVLCVFNPPVTGREVHDENGVYPLITDEPTDTPSAAS
ncbi:L-ectoine synthase [Spinactinospora alkalitolerans]|uniref:L-ectoine synthase n=1 Tax=Spinactinospora alkalitolerans TaxID=687207 RepID=A0A852TNT8_9ACTN|nr:ectoine synthase [Spinactinospora alkalitolerans]NYE45265.1 L-ectoine synthase [Spinactinospora alkalitolerans]